MNIGIIGGTFNPVHIGHVMLAEHFREQLDLDKVIVIPSGIPPHKEYNAVVSSTHRLEMCALAFSDEHYEISDIEIKRRGKSYTIDTLRQLKEIYPDAGLFLMMGADMLMILEKWKDYENIVKTATICASFRNVCGRDEILHHAQYLRENGANVIIDEKLIPDVSSTQIRTGLENGEDVSGLLPESVFKYIKDNCLYGGVGLEK